MPYLLLWKWHTVLRIYDKSRRELQTFRTDPFEISGSFAIYFNGGFTKSLQWMQSFICRRRCGFLCLSSHAPHGHLGKGLTLLWNKHMSIIVPMHKWAGAEVGHSNTWREGHHSAAHPPCSAIPPRLRQLHAFLAKDIAGTSAGTGKVHGVSTK